MNKNYQESLSYLTLKFEETLGRIQEIRLAYNYDLPELEKSLESWSQKIKDWRPK